MSQDSERIDAHRQLLSSLDGYIHPTVLPGPDDLIEIGSLEGLPIWSSSLAINQIGIRARKLARHGRTGMLIADDCHSLRRVFTVTINPIRLAVVGMHDPDPLPLARLRGRRRCAGLLASAIACAQALDVDAAGRRAFRSLRKGIDFAVDALPRKMRVEKRHAWVLLQVTRLLFLRFVESEGWLNGQRDFLRSRIDDCLERRAVPETALLAPLFFGMLNRPERRRSRRVISFGKIPFLNGGLFEPHPVERMHRWRLPPEVWVELLALVIDNIEVTLDDEIASDYVTPELIGRVFEGVMDPEERHDTGAYYTSTALVNSLAREALIEHLAHADDKSVVAVSRLLSDPTEEFQRRLLKLRILDPAAGSGAFLVGMLNQILGSEHRSTRQVRHVVTHCLYGIDKNPAAIRIAELRLWLEILRSMRGRSIGRLNPLPNLDQMMRLGDALIDPLSGQGLPPSLVQKLRAQSRKIQSLRGSARRRSLRQVRTLEMTAALAGIDLREEQLMAIMAETLDHQRAPTLFGGRQTTSAPVSRRLRDIRDSLLQLRVERRRLGTREAPAAFAIESAWPIVAEDGGFDMVIGNPPWVRAKKLPRSYRDRLTGRYRWWRGSGTGWKQLPDLSVAFVERSMEILRPGGTLALLVPSKLTTTDYARSMRRGLIRGAALHCVADLTDDPRAEFEATTYPMALIASKTNHQTLEEVRLGLGWGACRIHQQDWLEEDSWEPSNPSLTALRKRIRQRHQSIGERFTPGMGLKTGANRVFLNPPSELSEWTRPAIRGRDVSPFHASISNKLLWPADSRGRPLASLSEPLAAYLNQHRDRLKSRADYVGGAWWKLYRTELATSDFRIVWPDISILLNAAPLISGSPIPLNSCYLLSTPTAQAMMATSAWLNSGPIRALAKLRTESAANGYSRYGSRAVASLPLPLEVMSDSLLIRLAESPDQATLDEHVGSVLGLSTSERDSLDAVISGSR